jgi:hypothetical protein
MNDAWVVEQATSLSHDICSDWTTVAQAAGLPTEQERDGYVHADMEGQDGGLLSAVDTGYVATSPPTPEKNATGAYAQPPGERCSHHSEAVVGRLSAKYPDSSARLTVLADSLVITLCAAAPALRDSQRLRLTFQGFQAQHDRFPPCAACHQRFAVSVHRLSAHQSGFDKANAATGWSRRPLRSSKWRALATCLNQGPQDVRRAMQRALVRLDDLPDGTRQASASLRLPSLRLRLSQPVIAFLQVRQVFFLFFFWFPSIF